MTGENKYTLYCSFCGKSQHEASRLIAGPNVFICDECVDLCFDIILEHKYNNSHQHRSKNAMSKKKLPEKNIEMSPRQIAWIDALNADMDANKSALETTLNSYRNTHSRILEDKQKFWAEMHTLLKTDSETIKLKMEHFEGRVYCVVTDEKTYLK